MHGAMHQSFDVIPSTSRTLRAHYYWAELDQQLHEIENGKNMKESFYIIIIMSNTF